MKIMARISLPGLKFHPRVAVSERNKFVICLQHVLITAGLLICRLRIGLFGISAVRLPPRIASGGCNPFDLFRIHILHHPMEVYA